MGWIHPITQIQIPDYLVGVITPMFTPAREDGTIDEDGLRQYTRRLVREPSVTSLFWRSGVGRMYTFSMEEIRWSLDIVLSEAGEKKPVLLGASGCYHGDFTRTADPVRYKEETLELCELAQAKRLMAVVLVIPAGLPVPPGSSPEEVVIEFYEFIHQRTGIPILIYNPQNIPDPFQIAPRVVARLAPLPRVAGMKLSTNDMYRMSILIDAAGEHDFTMIGGSECVYYHALMTGAAGVIGQGCSVYPRLLRAILDHVVKGDFESARRAQFAVNRALACFRGLPPDQSGFAYLRHTGLAVSPYCRDRSMPVDEETARTIYNEIEAIVQDGWHGRS